MASVAVGISYMGPLGGNQDHQPYPSGPSQPSTFKSLGHLGIMGALMPSVIFFFCLEPKGQLIFFLYYLVSV
jgi:hypothetical protein